VSQESPPSGAEQTRIATDLDGPVSDPEATRIAADIDRPALPPGFDPEATRIGSKDLLAAVRKPGAPAPVERWRIGDRIGGRYEVLAIHRGAMGVVYGTFDHVLHLPRALKTIQDRYASNPKMRDAFAAEASVWVRLEKHPFIARAYRVERFGGLPYVVTEYVRGKEGRGPDLRSWIGDASVGVPVAIELALQIAQGMQHAVRKVPGLVHRDLKPANILVNDRAQAMVTDFGLAAGAGLEGGTPAYMAPEQWRDEPPDVRTDIYAYGCILYELLTRHRLYAAVSESEWRHAHLELSPYPLRAHCPELPEELEGFVLRCLDKQRDRRPAGWDDVVEICARWFHRLTGQPAVLDFSAYAFDANELLTAGYSLSQLGGHGEEKLDLYDRALAAGTADDETTAILLVNKGIALGELGREDEAIRVCDEVVSRFADAPEAGIREQVVRALLSKDITLGQLGRGEEAIRVSDEVVSRFADAPEAGIREQVAKALLNKGVRLGELGRREEAIRVYDEVVSRFGDAPETIREQVARALVNKGVVLGELGRREEAIRVYDEVVSRFPDATEAGVHEQVARALFSKAVTLGQLGRGEEEIRVYDEVASRFSDAPEAGIRQQVASALFNKGFRLGHLGRGEEEILVYDEVASRFGDAPEAGIRQQVASAALFNKGFRLGKLGRGEEAIRVYEEVVSRFGDATEAGIRERVANALFNKGVRLGQLGRGEAAIRVYEEVVSRFGNATEAGIRELVAVALFSKGFRLGALGRREEAGRAYEEVVSRFGDAPEASIREWVAKALGDKGVTLGQLGLREDAIRAYEEVISRFGDATEAGIREAVARATGNLEQARQAADSAAANAREDALARQEQARQAAEAAAARARANELVRHEQVRKRAVASAAEREEEEEFLRQEHAKRLARSRRPRFRRLAITLVVGATLTVAAWQIGKLISNSDHPTPRPSLRLPRSKGIYAGPNLRFAIEGPRGRGVC